AARASDPGRPRRRPRHDPRRGRPHLRRRRRQAPQGGRRLGGVAPQEARPRRPRARADATRRPLALGARLTVLSVFCSPSRYTQGRNATAGLGAEMTALGLEGPALIVAGSSALARLADVWRETLGKAGIAYAVHRFGGECSHAEIARVEATGRAQRARVVVGAGGGKVLDTARAAAAGLGVPVVNCPTLASSDAPCSALSVIYTDEGEFQEYRFYGKNPDLVLVDTQVIAEARPDCSSPAWATR